MTTPENILTVAILLNLHHEMNKSMQAHFGDEDLTRQERYFFTSVNERIERELAASYARQLLPLARQASIPPLYSQLDTTTGYHLDWEHEPASRPDYTIEREKPLEVRHNEELIWREPPVILDAKYYLKGSDPTNTHGPIKKMLGDMTLLGAHTGALFFPRIPEPTDNQHRTRIIRRSGQQYSGQHTTQHISLYHLDPHMPFEIIQQRFRAILDHATEQLPERPQPTCQGHWINPAATDRSQERTVLCPKPHIGNGVFDLVNADTDCLKNPRLCHVIEQFTTPPYLVGSQKISSENL